MRVTVLGGTRFIGPFVVRRLVAQGHQVTVVHRGEHERDDLGPVRHVHTDRAELAAAMAEIGDAEVAVDMAPWTEADMRTALDALRGHVGRLVAVSSVDVYRVFGALLGIEDSPLPSPPVDEDAPLRTVLHPYRHRPQPDQPAWMHDYDKILVERLVLEDSQVRGTVLRLGAVYGPGDNQHRLRRVVQAADRGEDIALEQSEAEALWPYVYVDNVAAAIALAVSDERAAGRVYNVGPEPTPSNAEFMQRAAQLLGWRGRVVVTPGEPPRHQLDLRTDRIRRELGYVEPVGFEESIRSTAEWERT